MTIETEKELLQRNQKVTDIVHKYAASFGGDLPLECQGVTAQEILEMAAERADSGNVPFVAKLIEEGLSVYKPDVLAAGAGLLLVTVLESGCQLRGVTPIDKADYRDDLAAIRQIVPQLQDI